MIHSVKLLHFGFRIPWQVLRSFLEDLTPTFPKSKVLISFLLDELEIVYVKNADVKEIPEAVENIEETENLADQPQILVNNIKTEINQEIIVPEESDEIVPNDNVEEADIAFEDQVEVKEDPLEQESVNIQSTNEENDLVQTSQDENVEIDSTQQIRKSKLRKRKGNRDDNAVDIPSSTKRIRIRKLKKYDNNIKDEEKNQSKTQRTQANRKYIFVSYLLFNSMVSKNRVY